MQNQNTMRRSILERYGLGSSLLSAAFAGAMIAAPRKAASYLSLPKSRRLVRLLAARDLLIGATLLNGAMRRQGLAMRGIADATDAALILTQPGRAYSWRRSPTSSLKAGLALTGAVCALGLALIGGTEV